MGKNIGKDLKEAILGIEVTQFDGQKADLEELVNPKQLEKIISDWMADKESEPETVADVIADFYKSLERLKEVLRTEVEELEE